MSKIKKIKTGSAFKLGGVLYAMMGLILGALFTLVALLGGLAEGGA